jgi:hypothetical protein
MTQTLDIQLEPILEPPSGINGPTNALEWLEPSLLNEALSYFANLQVESRDEQEIAYARTGYIKTWLQPQVIKQENLLRFLPVWDTN